MGVFQSESRIQHCCGIKILYRIEVAWNLLCVTVVYIAIYIYIYGLCMHSCWRIWLWMVKYLLKARSTACKLPYGCYNLWNEFEILYPETNRNLGHFINGFRKRTTKRSNISGQPEARMPEIETFTVFLLASCNTIPLTVSGSWSKYPCIYMYSKFEPSEEFHPSPKNTGKHWEENENKTPAVSVRCLNADSDSSSTSLPFIILLN